MPSGPLKSVCCRCDPRLDERQRMDGWTDLVVVYDGSGYFNYHDISTIRPFNVI